jgi:hypothetical protein
MDRKNTNRIERQQAEILPQEVYDNRHKYEKRESDQNVVANSSKGLLRKGKCSASAYSEDSQNIVADKHATHRCEHHATAPSHTIKLITSSSGQGSGRERKYRL